MRVVQIIWMMIVLTVFIFFSLVLIDFTTKYSVNIPFWDELDMIDKFVHHTDILKIIFTSNGNEHRIGTGLLFMVVVSKFTQWNIVVESYLICLILITSALFIFGLRDRFSKTLVIFDSIIFMLCLSLYQYENLLWGFQITFVLPYFFLTLNLFLLRDKNILYRNIYIFVFSFLAVYSSFHGIATLIASAFVHLSLEYITTKDLKKTIIFTSFYTIILIIYFAGFNFWSAVDIQKSFSLVNYFQYISMIVNNFWGLRDLTILKSLILIVLVSGFLVNIINSYINKSTAGLFIFSLYLYSFLFLLFTAIGRVGLGLETAFAPRYVTHVIPAFVGLYYTFREFSLLPKVKYVTLSMYILITSYLYVNKLPNNYFSAEYERNGRNLWKNCLLVGYSYTTCSNRIEYNIYIEGLDKNNEIEILRQNSLSLFSEKQ